jgi:hypothetical protein
MGMDTTSWGACCTWGVWFTWWTWLIKMFCKTTTTTAMKILRGLSHLFSDEKKRGMLTSIVNGSFITAMNYVGVMFLGLTVPVSTLLFVYIMGSITGYTMDILFAKREFLTPGGGAVAAIPYRDIMSRVRWLLWSIPNSPFYKFLVAGIIETLTGIAIIRAIIAELDKRMVMADNRQTRNLITAMLVAALVFLLFGNILRFDWAYSSVEVPLMNISVLMWMAITILVFALVHTMLHEIRNANTKASEPAILKEDARA